MLKAEYLVSYASLGIVLFAGVMIIAGYVGFLEPIYRIGLGLIIIAYAGVRLVLLDLARRRNGKKP